jgi:hypothetical protein
MQPGEIIRGSLLERTIWHKKGCQTCAGSPDNETSTESAEDPK